MNIATLGTVVGFWGRRLESENIIVLTLVILLFLRDRPLCYFPQPV